MGHLSRRTVLGSGLAAGAGLALSACTGSGTEPGGSGEPGGAGGGGGGAGGGAMPNHIPFDGPTPDLPGDAETGVPDAYLKYPDPPQSTGTVPLGLSAPVEFLLQGRASAVPMEQNQWWQLLNEEAGAEIRITAVSSTEYLAKFQTSVSGDVLSDITQIVTVPQLPALLDKMFVDLSPYLSGDNVAKYPNLANHPPSAWSVSVFDGKVYGIPQPRITGGMILLTHGDRLAEKGIDLMPELADGEAFLDMVRELHDPAGDRFAIGQLPENWTVPLVLEAMGGPNVWDTSGDTWVSEYETPEYEAALEVVTKMFAEGLYHPNSYTDQTNSHTWFNAGTTALLSQNFANWQAKANLDTEVGVVVMPKWDGGGSAVKHLGAPAYTAPVGLKKIDDEARIDELLRLLDYIASPFGTQEFLHVNYGVKDRQWTLTDGELARIADAPEEAIGGLNYAGASIWRDVYMAGKPDMTERIHTYCAEQIPNGMPNPTLGKFSDTAVTKAPPATRKLSDLQGAIIQGRSSLTEWSAAVQEWKKECGDAMAEEYAEQE
ncbi:extracellular solute-binding protein [Microlunatus sp. Y2014]|uniref:extracellular solute-binding protein n=1 Tax=Microlunatus sp. Y2014 TaxID=3418488 RepID=UPI003DA75541